MELLGDAGTKVAEERDSVLSSLNRLSQSVVESVEQIDLSEEGVVVPEAMAQSFTSSQLQLLINMLQKVQAAQSPGEGGGGGAGDNTAAGLTSPSQQTPLYEVDEHVTLKGNFSKLK